MNFKKIRLNIEEIKLELIIENMIELIEFQTKEKKIDLKFINFCQKQHHFYSDATRIEQILLNLMSNALKFTIKRSIQVILEQLADPFYKISVKDTGIGIKKDDMSKLFRLFGRLEADGKMNKTGILILIAGSVIIAGVAIFFLMARHTMLPAYIIVPCEAATAVIAVCFGRKKSN